MSPQKNKTSGKGGNKSVGKLLMLAALLAGATAAVHVVAGGRQVAAPMMESNLAEIPRLTLYAGWHMISVTLGISAVAYLIASLPAYRRTWRPVARFVSLLWVAFGAVFIVVIVVQERDDLWLELPQWIMLAPTGLIGFLGARS
ncbi:MAG: hypothetical protein Q3979_10015 [Actinomycetaceae bacterium]|nr:hypothetical protein [Actinomycetaceae bacterium]